jgi:hypothetical protein
LTSQNDGSNICNAQVEVLHKPCCSVHAATLKKAQPKKTQAPSFIRDHAIPPQFDFKAPLPSSQARLKEGGPDSS